MSSILAATKLAANQSRFTFTAGEIPFLVVGFDAEEKISDLFKLTLELACEEEIAPADVIGQPALLTIESDDQARRLHGIVHECFVVGTSGRFFLYKAMVRPAAALLAHRTDCRIFQHQNVPAIVTQVLNQAGLTGDLFTFRLQGNYADHDYCVQYRETDIHFICRLLAEEGIFFFFEHSSDNHLMVFGDSPVNYQPIAGEDKVPFNPGGGTVAETEAVLGFSRGQRILSGKYAQRDFNFEKPALDLSARNEQPQQPTLELYDYPGTYELPEQGARLARVRLEAASMNRDQAIGESVIARFLPGFTFTLTDGQVDGQDGQYLLTDLVHKGKQPQVLAELSDHAQGTVYHNDFKAIPADVPVRRNGKVLEKPVVRGVQTAIVTGPAGEEIYTDRHGRIKVQFHWDRLGQNDENSSCWIRVSQGWAGAGWGSMHIPRIGQEVIVDFLEGDPDRPLVTGRVYHGENIPPYALPEHKTRSTIKSETTPGGNGSNEIRFEDKKDSEEIYIHGQKDWNISIENDKGQTIGHDETLDVANNRTKTVGVDQKETIGANKRIEVGENHDETIGKNKTINVGADHVEAIKQNADITIGGDLTRTVVKNSTQKIGESLSVNVTRDSEEMVGDNKSIDVGKTFNTHAADQIHTLSDKQITLESGSAVVVVKSNGDVMITGTSVSVKATGAITLKGAKVFTN